jgi:ABC-type transport system involved in Fe-S cluster assembly fused permease/ATPase subunit
LPILFVAVSTPRISYEPVETSSLLPNGVESSDRGREAYGTFDESTTTSRAPSAPPHTGINTPATNKPPVSIPKHIKIPKTLGETRKEDPPLEWRVVWGRMIKLAPYLWPSTSRKLQFYVFICVLTLIAGRILQPALPLSLGQVVRVLTQNTGGQQGPSVWPAFITYFVIRLCVSGSGIIYFIQQRLWIPVSQYSDREMMMMCFNHLLNLSLSYHTRRNTGEVLKVIDRGSAINNLFQVILFTALPTFFDMFIAYGLFFYLYGPVLAGVSVIVMVLYLILAVTATSRRTVIRRQLTERDVKQRGIISDVLTNWESVKYFTAERRERHRFHEALLSYQEAEARWTASYQVVYLLQSFLLVLGLMCGSIMIAYRVLHGTSDAAEFVVFIQYFQQLSSPLDRLGMLYQQLNRNSIDAEKMFSLLAETTEVNDLPDAKDLVITDGVIEFDNVKFSYDGKVPALKGVSFKIDKGQSMALVGESGSGKSTILRLLYRFYDVDSGVIRIDGQDIARVTQSSLRRAIGIVPQDSVLWNDTIGANISYGKEGATDEEIISAARAAKLHERILSFTEGYSTIVGERGIRLSGGEKQRVSLARMFLKSPAILVSRCNLAAHTRCWTKRRARWIRRRSVRFSER